MESLDSLAVALPKQQSRVRELIREYSDPTLKGAGNMAIMFMEAALKRADIAVMSGDITQMILAYEDLKEYE